ncbi:hypothetical protein [Falsibacillus albus]|uniref:Uncharacterized protein n=1 Tax=Falsibacillus albus TaxID=2478915 RepID=A0A3L7K2V8_9BACI|nr:hypothetical protein [Falsibacillus albus]RLQ96321.1 hypothetical protein D9X91_08545 [Falsibacillus albus]
MAPSENDTALQQDQGCTNTVSQQVCVEAVVTITPSVTPGLPTVSCVGLPIVGSSCADQGFTPSTTIPPSCTTTFAQVLCVNVPLTFNADVQATAGQVGCGPAFNAPNCPSACTHTIGFYQTHPEVVNALITAAGGSIILGIDSMGLSLTATTLNAEAILSVMAPIPPTPANPPFRGQYRALYAQLLAANLNILRGATCSFATETISEANTFLANSPPAGMAGAPDLTVALTAFNEGSAAGCPAQCLSQEPGCNCN